MKLHCLTFLFVAFWSHLVSTASAQAAGADAHLVADLQTLEALVMQLASEPGLSTEQQRNTCLRILSVGSSLARDLMSPRKAAAFVASGARSPLAMAYGDFWRDRGFAALQANDEAEGRRAGRVLQKLGDQSGVFSALRIKGWATVASSDSRSSWNTGEIPTTWAQYSTTRRQLQSSAFLPHGLSDEILTFVNSFHVSDVSWWGDSSDGDPLIVIRLRDQRAWFMKGRRLVGETSICSGSAETPTLCGDFMVTDKKKDCVEQRYGDWVSANGEVLAANVDREAGPAPRGAVFRGAVLRDCIFLGAASDADLVMLHAGSLPGYPATTGDVRMPGHMAELFFDNVQVGTRVIIAP